MGSRRNALKEKLSWAIINSPSKDELEQLMQIEISAHEDPWTYDSLLACFTDNCRCIGLYLHDELIGFCIISIICDEAEIYTIGILRKYQGLGFGHKLLVKSLQLCKELGAANCYLEVRVSNEVALYLYDLYGFSITGTRKNYYAANSYHGPEDAYTMACPLTTWSAPEGFELKEQDRIAKQ